MSQDVLNDHECRIRSLEIGEATMKTDIRNLIERVDTLIGWMQKLVISVLGIIGTGVISAIGFLIYEVYQVIKKVV